MIELPGLRRATVADVDAIQAILATDPPTWELLEGAPLRPDEAAHLLAELPPGVAPERKHVFVADGTCVVDLIDGFPDAATWYLGLIFVAPHARGSTYGTHLIDRLALDLPAAGARALRLAVVAENARARRLYERLDFRHVATRTRTSRTGVAQSVDVVERDLAHRHPAPGPWYVDDSCCTVCGVPAHLAPRLFANHPNGCYVRRQPATAEDDARMFEVLETQDLDCIHYRGDDVDLLARLRARGMGRVIG